MTIAQGRRLARVATALAAVEAARRLRPQEGEVRREEHVVEAPEKSQLDEKSALLNQIKARQASLEWLKGAEREQAVQEIRELAGRYRSIVDTGNGREEIGVEVEKAPMADRIASKIPGLHLVADTRPREVHTIAESRKTVGEHIDETNLERTEEGADKAGEILGRIKTTNDPGVVAVLVEDLSMLEREYEGDVLKNAEVGSFMGTMETINDETRKMDKAVLGNVGTLGGRIEEETKMAEHLAVHERDIQGAAERMREVGKETVTRRELLSRVTYLKNQAAYLALTGDEDGALLKVAELTVVSSSLPDGGSKQALVVPKTPNEVIDGIRRSEGLNAREALKVVGVMHDLSLEARKRGVGNAGVVDVYMEVMELKSEQGTSIMQLLGSVDERERIIERMAGKVKTV